MWLAMIGMKVRSMKSNKVQIDAVGAEMLPPWIVNSLGVDEESLGMEATTTRTSSGSEVGWDGPLKLIEDGLEVVRAGPA